MYIEKRIRLGNTYYVGIEVEYKRKTGLVFNPKTQKRDLESPYIALCLKGYAEDKDYYDGHDFSEIIADIEKRFKMRAPDYRSSLHSAFMLDIMYIYERIPFLKYVKDIYISQNESVPYSQGIIYKEEIDRYIAENGVDINFRKNPWSIEEEVSR